MFRKEVRWSWVLVLATVWLSACGPTAMEPPPAATRAPTRLVEATDTAAPTMTSPHTPMPELTMTPTDSPTDTPTPTQTPTPTATATRRPTVTPTQESVGTLTPTPTLGPLVTRTPGPPGICPALGEDVPEITSISPGTGIVEGFEPQIRAYLDAGGSPDGLRAALNELTLIDDGTTWQPRVQVMAVDVTGNTTPDVVVDLIFYVEGQFGDGGVLAFSCQEGQYDSVVVTRLGGQVPAGTGPDPGIRVIQDMNANGVPDIALSYVEVMGTHGNFTRQFRILEWDGSQFVDLVQSDTHPPNAASVENGDGSVYDTNGNRNLELVLINGVGGGYEDSGPQRERIDTWAWDGYTFRLLRSEYEPPIYRFQAIQDGDDAARAGRYEDAVALYKQALLDEELLGWSQGQLWPDSAYGTEPTPTPDPDERARLTAYSIYRIMLVYLLQDSAAEAEAAYDVLQEQYAESAYTALTGVFWSEYRARQDTAAACAKVRQYAEAHADEILAPLGSGFYGYSNRDYRAEDVCPFE